MPCFLSSYPNTFACLLPNLGLDNFGHENWRTRAVSCRRAPINNKQPVQSQELSMSFRSGGAKNVVLRMVGVMPVATALVTVSLTTDSFVRAQPLRIPTPPEVRLPDESPGIDAIARTLVSAFDQADIVALG